MVRTAVRQIRPFQVVRIGRARCGCGSARPTDEIDRHIAEVRSATAEAVTAVAGIATMIGEVNAIAGSIVAAVEEQGSATAEIARGVTETATAVNAMNTRNAEVAKEAKVAGCHASEVLDGTRTLDGAIDDLKRALIRTVRTSTAEVDRRMFQREAVDLPCRLEVPGEGSIAAHIGDLSEGGARLTGTSGLRPGTWGKLRIGELAPIAFTVRGIDGADVRLAFEMDDVGREALRVYGARREPASCVAGGVGRRTYAPPRQDPRSSDPGMSAAPTLTRRNEAGVGRRPRGGHTSRTAIGYERLQSRALADPLTAR